MDFFTAEFFLSQAGQITAVVLLVAATRLLLKDLVPAVYVGAFWSIFVVLLAAFWLDVPVAAQTAAIALLNATVILAGAFGSNEALARWFGKRTPQGFAAADASESLMARLFRPY